jgi:alpha-glucosidase
MFTRTLLELRRLLPTLMLGSYQAVEQDNPSCFVYQRQWQKQRCLVALNFSDQEQILHLSGQGRILLTTRMDNEGKRDLSKLRLRGNEGLLIEILAHS